MFMLKNIKPISEILARTIKKLGISARLRESEAASRFSEIVGEKISKHAEVESIKAGQLVVRVKSPVWRQELNFQKQEIIKSLNKAFGEKIVKDIYFRA